MKIDRSNPKHWFLLFLQALFACMGAILRIFMPRPARPRVVFYSHQYSGNVKALYERWQTEKRDSFECHCLFLDPETARSAEELGVRVLRCNRARDMLMASRADIFITDHGLHALVPLKHFTSILFVDVWHGIPFKGFLPSDFALQHSYDEVWVSSPLLRDLYVDNLGFPNTIVKPAGYARADKLFRNDPPQHSFRKSAGLQGGIVLYAPTWEHEDESRSQMPFGESYSSFYCRLGELCIRRNTTLVVRSHLNTSIESGSYPGVIFCSMADFPDTESLLQETDVLICDWSSIAFDYLATGKPTLFLDVKPPFRAGYTLGPEYRFGPVLASLDTLADALDDALSESPLYWQRYGNKHEEVTKAVYGKNSDGNSALRQLQRVEKLLEKR